MVLEELAAEFGLKAQDAINRVTGLEAMGRISGKNPCRRRASVAVCVLACVCVIPLLTLNASHPFPKA